MSKIKEWFYSPWTTITIIVLLIVITASNVFTTCGRLRGRKLNYVSRNVNLVDSRWQKLQLILNQIEENYVDTVNYKDIVEKTIPVLLSSLDPHSVYLPPKDLEEADESLQGNFGGIGIEFNIPLDTLVVINVIANGPSQKVGIQSGDRIVTVDGKNVAGINFPQDSIVKLLRGEVGTTVDVVVKRIGVEAPLNFTIKRDIIPEKSVDVATMITPQVGYIKLSRFSRTSYMEFALQATQLKKSGMTTLIFDLRDNPGGYMDQALAIANEFLEKDEMIVYTQGRHRPREEYKANGKGRFKGIKLYIAINENSASSSEIVAGAIQDSDRGVIIGRRSFGKGLVQEPIYFSDSSGIRLTVSRFYTPSGRSIQKPYSESYVYDIYERYRHGEMQNADSIPKNDSLIFYTLKQKRVVYGGGGIIPDTFVPLDTVGVTQFLINVNRNSLSLKFSSEFADRHREQLSNIKTFSQLEKAFGSVNLSNEFLSYAKKHGVVPEAGEWQKSGPIILSQLKGLIGRYSGMETDTYYSYILQVDNLIDKIKEMEDIQK